MQPCTHLLLAILLGILSSGSAIAHTQTSAKISKKELKAIAGCLTRSGNEYRLLGSDGSLWEIQVEKPIDLTNLTGKRVEARGAVSPESPGKNAETKQDGNQKKTHVGRMKANSIRRIEGACP
ncbi:MAG TPA: hypothetical protein VGS78_04270 [Candidatus Sulfotelmatobacter sp.]|nr:hypothetical protein [Candidatus Sulfotelmatobacter sp.]